MAMMPSADMPCATRSGAGAALAGGGAGVSLRQNPASVVIPSQKATLWLPKIASGLAQLPRWATLIAGMIDLLKLLGGLLVGVFRSHAARDCAWRAAPDDDEHYDMP
jgi:hypothetical protein